MSDESQSSDGWQQYTESGDTWWYDGDCPECGHVVSNNGRVRVCGEESTQCDWWERAGDDDE